RRRSCPSCCLRPYRSARAWALFPPGRERALTAYRLQLGDGVAKLAQPGRVFQLAQGQLETQAEPFFLRFLFLGEQVGVGKVTQFFHIHALTLLLAFDRGLFSLLFGLGDELDVDGQLGRRQTHSLACRSFADALDLEEDPA